MKGQLSLAKFLFIISGEDNPKLTTHDVADYFKHVLERVDWTRDLHFHTRTTIDTLDYSGTDLNSGSKVVIAAAGNKIRELGTSLSELNLPDDFSNPKVVMPGIVAIQGNNYLDAISTEKQIQQLNELQTGNNKLQTSFPLLIICDDSDFVSKSLSNFL